MQAIKNLVTSQHEIILDLLSEHRAEVDEKIQLKARCFSSKQIEKQYHVNTEFREFRESRTSDSAIPWVIMLRINVTEGSDFV